MIQQREGPYLLPLDMMGTSHPHRRSATSPVPQVTDLPTSSSSHSQRPMKGTYAHLSSNFYFSICSESGSERGVLCTYPPHQEAQQAPKGAPRSTAQKPKDIAGILLAPSPESIPILTVCLSHQKTPSFLKAGFIKMTRLDFSESPFQRTVVIHSYFL